jgi:hypothetical protein
LGRLHWGKHAPVDFRGDNRASGSDRRIQNRNVLSVVSIRDPYDWMKSMCRYSYSASWKHAGEHCSNLIADKRDLQAFPQVTLNEQVKVKVKYPKEIREHTLLAHFYNAWYTDYLETKFP